MLQTGRHRRATAVFGQRQFGSAPANFLRVHDLVGLALLENAVLMNAAGMGECILANDGFAALHDQSAHARDQAGATSRSRAC